MAFQIRLSRRILLTGAASACFAAPATALWARARPDREPNLVARLDDGVLQVIALSDRAFRVRFVPADAAAMAPTSQILVAGGQGPRAVRREVGGTTRLDLPFIRCEVAADGSQLRFFDRQDRLLLSEQPGARRLTPSDLQGETVFQAEQGFISPEDEHLYGTGCFQDGHLNLRGMPRRLTQVNTQISLPFMLSSRGYGLLWHNYGMSELNTPDRPVALRKRAEVGEARLTDVTTTQGNAKVERREASFEGVFTAARKGRHAFLLDLGRKMSSRHHVEIDGEVLTDHSNHWLPPTASFIAELDAGEHRVKVLAEKDDVPSMTFAPVEARTVWRSPVADAIDYVVIAGPAASDIVAGYREIAGQTPMMPIWALGYIHCRERFHSQEEILATAREFRERKLPVDMMVQDWQYWGKYDWNAMRFDEEYYPDPAGLCRDLHGMDMRFMLSVWSKIGRDTELGKQVAARNFYIPDTDWVDFFNPTAATFYADNQKGRLAVLGIDAWWQDATEPENDDLVGRRTAAGPGERQQLTYPLQVSRTVYEEQRAAYPDKRVMILTRSGFPGQQRYSAATWSGDIGNDWESLKRQIPAGLNMAAAAYPYWTVDAGGFFRPGEGQYTDPAYHERFIRWFQYATFLPLQRVHGYMTDTEFWRFGNQVESVSRTYLELRYRLMPYIYGLAAEATRAGMPLMRPLVFDFPDDPAALDQTHSYMFGAALHVAPVVAEGVKQWPVYLPKSSGGWYDFWTGEHRAGGREHSVPAPIERIPLHVRAGAILPLGPVVQSTVQAQGRDMEIVVFPGRDGSAQLYEDDGLSYGYEQGASATIKLDWNDAHGVLTIGARKGHFPGMQARRNLRIRLGGVALESDGERTAHDIAYDGRSVSVKLGRGPS